MENGLTMEVGRTAQWRVAQVSGQGIEPVTIQVHNTMANIALEILRIIPFVRFLNAQVSFWIVKAIILVILVWACSLLGKKFQIISQTPHRAWQETCLHLV